MSKKIFCALALSTLTCTLLYIAQLGKTINYVKILTRRRYYPQNLNVSDSLHLLRGYILVKTQQIATSDNRLINASLSIRTKTLNKTSPHFHFSNSDKPAVRKKNLLRDASQLNTTLPFKHVLTTSPEGRSLKNTEDDRSTISEADIKWLNNIAVNMTLVTAYWNIGTFRKGATHFSPKLYLSWARAFKLIVNPLVVYTDSEEFCRLMQNVRSTFPNRTKIVLKNRTELWPFNLVSRIQEIIRSPGYPRHHPNTVIPEYSASQHAKYAVLAETAKRQLFHTPYYAWLDVGYFRYLVNDKHFFKMKLPAHFDENRISVNLVHNVSLNITPYNVFRRNSVWVGGGLLIGTGTLVVEFEKLYRKATLFFMDKKLVNTDQQVLYSTYTKEGTKDLKPQIQLQRHIPKGGGNPWFYLGYHCREVVDRKSN